MNKERILWIDQLRSIAFLFVIIGHVALPKEVQSLIYSFHMPLFFLISGLTINRKKLEQIELKKYIQIQAQRLVIPYLWMNFLMFPLWYFAFHYITQSTKLTIVQAFWGIFIGNNMIVGAPSNALWFVLVLFLANVLYCILLKIAKGQENVLFILMLCCAIIGYLEKAVQQIWHFNVAFTAVFLMYIGNCFMEWYKRNGKEIIRKAGILKLVICEMIFLMIGLISHDMNGRISMTANKFGDSIALFYITALSFSAFIILIVMHIPEMKIVTFIGKNTLLYVGIHIPILRIFEKLFPILLEDYRYSILFAFLLYFGIAPICALCNKWAPYVCGKTLEKNTMFIRCVKVLLLSFGAAVPYARFMKEFDLWTNPIVMLVILILLSAMIVKVCERKFKFVFLE